MTAGDLVTHPTRPSLGVGVVTDRYNGEPVVVRVEWLSVVARNAPTGRPLWGYYRESDVECVAGGPPGLQRTTLTAPAVEQVQAALRGDLPRPKIPVREAAP